MKDTLGDSGLLMDSDLTLCNSPDLDKSSQVQNIAKKFENKLLLSGDYNRPYQQHDYHYQPAASSSRLKTLPNTSYTTTSKARVNRDINQLRAPNSRNIKIIKVDPSTFHKKVNKSVMLNHQRNIVVYGNNNANAQNNFNENFAFNPFADENDSNQSFQLSKSANFQNQSGPIRLFGSDMTNFMNSNQTIVSEKPKANPSTFVTNTYNQNFSQIGGPSFMKTNNENQYDNSTDVYGRSVFRPDDNAIYSQSSNTENSCSNMFSDESQEPSQSQSSNELVFKTYDLNDEYWLNFDQ